MITRTYCKKDGCRRYANINPNGFCPYCQPTDESNDSQPCICGICNEEIQDGETSCIGCDSCEKWFHPSCAGPPELQSLLDLISKAGNNSSMKGLLLWLCPSCATGPNKLLQLDNSSCVIVPQTQPACDKLLPKTMQEQSYGEMCDLYQKNICPYGISGKGCEKYHPKLCRAYVKFGPKSRKGCSKGDSCSYFHPKLCSKSLKPVPQRFCTYSSCNLFHLPKTKRHFPHQLSHDRYKAPHSQNVSRNRYSESNLYSQSNEQNSFLGNLRSLIRESIQLEFASMQGQVPKQTIDPFLPGMNHFTQPLGQMRKTGPPPVQFPASDPQQLSQTAAPWAC